MVTGLLSTNATARSTIPWSVTFTGTLPTVAPSTTVVAAPRGTDTRIRIALTVSIGIAVYPDHALSDGAQSLTPANFAKLMDRLRTMSEALRRPLAPAIEEAEPKRARKAS